MMKRLILDEFDRDYSQSKAVDKKKNSPAPLVTDALKKSKWYPISLLDTPKQAASSFVLSPFSKDVKARQSLKVKLSKLVPSVLSSSSASKVDQAMSYNNHNSSIQKTSPITTNSGILKSFFSTSSGSSKQALLSSQREITNIDHIKRSEGGTDSPISPIRKKITPNLDISLTNSNKSNGNSTDSPSTSSASSLDDNSLELSDNAATSTGDANYAQSFNALNVANSPRLSRNSRRAKLNYKRQQNEEKRIEKQRRDQRLRTSQELARKLDEIGAKTLELEKEGNKLEVLISIYDNKKAKKDKLEQELYNVIHQRNLLTRCENKLNIQSRALAIEDKLSECQQRLRETMNVPEVEKTIEQIESEKRNMERIVEYIEEKNQLVEQLESLRIL